MFDEVVLSMSLMNKILSLDTVSGQLIITKQVYILQYGIPVP